jgi:hypothetical protein
MVLGRRAEEDLIAPALMHDLADRRRGIPTALDEDHRAAVGGALDERLGILGRPVRSVRMALGRDHQRQVAPGARTPLDLLEQMRRRLRAIRDDEQPDLSFGHGYMQCRRRAHRIIRIG